MQAMSFSYSHEIAYYAAYFPAICLDRLQLIEISILSGMFSLYCTALTLYIAIAGIRYYRIDSKRSGENFVCDQHICMQMYRKCTILPLIELKFVLATKAISPYFYRDNFFHSFPGSSRDDNAYDLSMTKVLEKIRNNLKCCQE